MRARFKYNKVPWSRLSYELVVRVTRWNDWMLLVGTRTTTRTLVFSPRLPNQKDLKWIS